MGPYIHIQEQVVAEHRRDLLHEREQVRLVGHAFPHHNAGRHTIAQLGVLLIKVGMKLKQVEQSANGVTAPLRG